MNRKKPRELLKTHSYESLTTEELLVLLFGHGTRKQSIYSLVKNLVPSFEMHREANRLTTEQYLETQRDILPGGKVYTYMLGALYELLKRKQEQKNMGSLRSPAEIIEGAFPLLGIKKVEHVYGVYLDTSLRIKNITLLSKGTIDFAHIEPHDVFYYAIKHRCRNIILVHNHPSGIAEPSREDISLTERIKKASELLYLNFLDHIIVAREGVYSFHSKKLVI